ncbi:SDR family NAD(P)-dependent oxidoreductase [Streptomycetaceae bacterium NBC_01309]
MTGALVIGAGPGIGQAVARRFAREGLPIALIARRDATLRGAADAIAPSGGMPLPKPQYVSLSLGKAGVRTLVTLLDEQYAHTGVHVASVTVDGPVAPGTDFDPDDIAEHYWRLHVQPRDRWDHEVLHPGRS